MAVLLVIDACADFYFHSTYFQQSAAVLQIVRMNKKIKKQTLESKSKQNDRQELHQGLFH